MLKIYLNTVDNQFLNAEGNFFPERSPELSVGGREEVHFYLKKATPDWGTAGADPSAWQTDTSWSEITGIAAMVTVDNDYRKYAKGTLTATVASGSRSVSATIANAEDIPHKGVLRLYQPDGSYESVAFSSREINDTAVTFALDTAVLKGCGQGGTLDCTTAPLAQAYLDAEKSHWKTGELVFDLVLDSERLRSENDYSDNETVAIKGLELLLYTVNNGTVQILRSFLLDTAILRNVQGNPGFNAPLPDPFADHIAAEVDRQLEGVASRVVPSIAANGNWVVDGLDTGKSSQGKQGEPGKEGPPGGKGDTGSPAGFGTITARAETIPTNYSASAVVTASGTNEAKNFSFVFQIPQGEKGDPMRIDATGVSTDLRNYDAQLKGFAFLATDTGKVYIKASDTVGDWSDPVGFQGPAGESAGFGTPSVSVEAIEEGENPSATVEATGSNTAKVFSFNFKLPKGKQGEQGEPGTIENFEIKVNSLASGKIAVKVNALPVMVKAPSGNYYPIEKTRLTGSTSAGWQIDPAPFLGYENMASFTGTWSVFCAGGVKGEAGEDGKNFDPDATGVFAERAQYDSREKGFAFLATDQEGNIYIKNSAAVGDWSAAIPFRGPKGDSPDVTIGANGNWEVDGVDTGKPSRGEAGPMAKVEIAPNGNWVVNEVDTGKSSRGKGANVILSPTMPTEPFEGMILISAQGVDPAFFDLEALKVLKGSTPPVTAEEGTIFIMEQ